MMSAKATRDEARLALVRWAACVGAVTADAWAWREGCSLATAAARLRAADRAGLLSARRVLVDEPTLYVVTRAGLHALGERAVDPPRISPANAVHTTACVRVGAMIERAYPDHTVTGERDLRRREHDAGKPLASALLPRGPAGRLAHRPDLVLWPTAAGRALPVAIEVELTVKSPRRLTEICRAWARSRCVAGTLYLASPSALAPLERALASVPASERIVLLALDGLLACERRSASTVPGAD